LLDGFFHFGADFEDVVVGQARDGNAQSALSVAHQLVACRLDVAFVDAGYVADPNLLAVVSLNEHARNVGHVLELVGHVDAHPSIAIV